MSQRLGRSRTKATARLLVAVPAIAVAGCTGPSTLSNASTCADRPTAEAAGQPPVSLVNCAGVIQGLPEPDRPELSVAVGSTIALNGLMSGAYYDPRSSDASVVTVTGAYANTATLKASQVGTAVISLATLYCQSNQLDGHCPALTVMVH